MKHFVVAATPIPGHFNPLMALAEHIAAKGHRVTVLTGSIYRERVLASGLEFALLPGIANYDMSRKDVFFTDRSEIEPGVPQLIYDMQRIFGDSIPDQHAALQELAAKEEVDLIVADLLFFGMLPMLMSPRAGRPAIVSCGIVPFMCRNPEVSPFTGPDSSPEGMLRNAEHNAQIAEALQPATSYVSAHVQACCGSPLTAFLFDEIYARPDLFLQFTTSAFEFPMRKLPGNVTFVGPMIPHHDPAATPAWIGELDTEKPVIFVTQGTIANYDFSQLIQPTLDGLADEPVQVVVTAGGGDASSIRLPRNARLESYLPYDDILPRASVFVTNGGYNGVQMALRAGVPIVSGGATEDKPFVSARVAWSGCGIDLKTGTPTAEQVRDAVRMILADTSYRQKAQAMQQTYEGCNALRHALDAMEALLAADAAAASAAELVTL